MQGEQHDAADNEGDAQPFSGVEPFAEKGDSKKGDKDDGEFVYRRDVRGAAGLQRLEVEQP